MNGRHDQDVRRLGQPREGIKLVVLGIECHVGRHLPLILEINAEIVEDRDRLLDLGRPLAGRVAERRIGQEGDMRGQAQPRGGMGGRHRDLRQRPGIGKLGHRDIAYDQGTAAAHSGRDADRAATGHRIEDQFDIIHDHIRVACDAGDHAVGMTHFQHAGRKHVAIIIDPALHVAAQIALALQAFVQIVGIFRIVLGQAGIAHFERPGRNAEFLHVGCHHILAGYQDGPTEALDLECVSSADHRRFFALGKDDGFLLAADRCRNALLQRGGRVEPARQDLAIVLAFGDGTPGDTAVDRGLGHEGRHERNQARIEGGRDDVVTPVLQAIDLVGLCHLVGHIFTCQGRKCLRCRDLHLFIDRARTHIQSAPEDVGEAQHIVDLIGIIRPARRHDHVITHLADYLGRDLGRRIGHRENDRVRRQCGDDLAREHAGSRQAQQDVGAFGGLQQGALVRVDGMFHQTLMPAWPSGIDDAFDVHDRGVFRLHAHRLDKLEHGQSRRPRAAQHDFEVLEPAARQIAGIDQPGGGDDRGPVLIVMEDRDIQILAQTPLDLETFRRLDVFQIDPAECIAKAPHALDELLRVGIIDLDIDRVDVGEALEKDRFAFHHRLGRGRAQIAQPQDRRAVGDDGNHIALGCIIVGRFRVFRDRTHRSGNAWRIGERQIALGRHRLGRGDAKLAGHRLHVEFERVGIELLIGRNGRF